MACMTVRCECGKDVDWYRQRNRGVYLCEHKTPDGKICPNSYQHLALLKSEGKVK